MPVACALLQDTRSGRVVRVERDRPLSVGRTAENGLVLTGQGSRAGTAP
ncbi:MAG: hypothetical protein R3F62_14810 [Planctomycetota bacterium]